MTAPITLDPAEPGPLYQQIATRLRAALAAGTLPAGSRLPSARVLASQLAVARGTVNAAYAVLAGEGAIEPRGGRNTTVAKGLTAAGVPPAQKSMRLAARSGVPATAPLPFRVGLPALDAFPHKQWADLTARVVRGMGARDLAYPDPAGLAALRAAIVAHVGPARGIACTPDQVFITGGFQSALTLVRQVLLRAGDPVWVEDPGYLPTRQALEAGGAAVVPIRVDQEGLRVQSGLVSAPRARLAIVTPTHQSPLGMALSLPRRLELLAWATDAGAWVLEDDYDGEFHYAGRPPPALKSLDKAERVLFGGSFSKTLFPGLRLGYLIVPDSLNGAFQRAARLLLAGHSALDQRVTATFLERGHFTRHIRRMRGLYAARRTALAAALMARFGERVAVDPAPGGMHLLARFTGMADDGTLVRRAAAAGLAPTCLSSLAMARNCGQGLLLGFANLPESDAADMVERLAACVLDSQPPESP